MTSHSDWARVLGNLELFAGLPDRALELIGQQMKRHHFVAGDEILTEDEGGSLGRMYIVINGTAQAQVQGDPVADYQPGDHFGEMSLLDGAPRSATVTATSELTTLSLASWNLRALLLEEPTIAVHMIEVLARRLRASNLGND